MKATLHELVAGMQHKNKFRIEYAWQHTQKKHPKILNPAHAKGNKDCGIDWPTYKISMNGILRRDKFLLTLGWQKTSQAPFVRVSRCCILLVSIIVIHLKYFLTIEMAFRVKYHFSTLPMLIGSLPWMRRIMRS